MPVSISGTNGVTFPDSSLQAAAASPYVLKNRIINGAMVIDQRNAGASVTATTSNLYTVDRWKAYAAISSKYSVQQNAGPVTSPAGYTNYLGVTSLSSYSVISSDFYFLSQPIEGYNVSDLAWGTANAKTVTLSFLVYSSLTGTFGGALTNNANTRSYPFTYTISSANTWTTISITIAGDTSATWSSGGNTTNGIGMYVCFGLGMGSTYSGTSGSWASATYYSATGATSVVGTNGATFYITGVQLEQNTTATPFERRLYNQELAACQRYFVSYGGVSIYEAIATGVSDGTNSASFPISTPVPFRSSPSVSGNNLRIVGATGISVSSVAINQNASQNVAFILANATGATSGSAYYLGANNSTAMRLQLSAEL